MGWKANIVIGTSTPGWEPTPECFRTDSVQVASLASEFAIAKHVLIREDTLGYGIWPRKRQEVAIVIAQGTQGRSLAAIADTRESGRLTSSHATNKHVQAMVRKFPQGIVVALELHSAVNFWGYALYERGKFVRAFSGDADNPIEVNDGMPQPEEASAIDPDPEFGGAMDGETCVFSIAGRVFGRPLSELPLERWPCVIVSQQLPWWKFW